MNRPPHVVPYQGSKRKLADAILKYADGIEVDTFYEPFAGSAAMTLAAASRGLAQQYVLNDKYAPLMALWALIINDPDAVSERYESLWQGQLPVQDTIDLNEYSYEHFMAVRKAFNQDSDPVKFLYLIARCVKNAVRFNSSGEFNQSPDKRRRGTAPDKMKSNIVAASAVLNQGTQLYSKDFREVTATATANDLVYMDPPWQGTSTKKDTRYAYVLQIEALIDEIERLNERHVPCLLSFDGACGDQTYGQDLPAYLNLKKIELDAGRSSQATLLGREHNTLESLYLSPALVNKLSADLLIAV